jgi:hypothetical protein
MERRHERDLEVLGSPVRALAELPHGRVAAVIAATFAPPGPALADLARRGPMRHRIAARLRPAGARPVAAAGP